MITSVLPWSGVFVLLQTMCIILYCTPGFLCVKIGITLWSSVIIQCHLKLPIAHADGSCECSVFTSVCLSFCTIYEKPRCQNHQTRHRMFHTESWKPIFLGQKIKVKVTKTLPLIYSVGKNCTPYFFSTNCATVYANRGCFVRFECYTRSTAQAHNILDNY